MRLGTFVDYAADFATASAEVVEFERLGTDLVAVAETYSFDAVSRLGYLAAITERVTLMSAILPLYSRTPSVLAMTAAGLDSLSGGRFELGIGASGPQVIEGFHGVPYAAPLGRVRETIEICRQVWKREPLVHQGPNYRIPLPADEGTGLSKPLKLINRPVRERIPIVAAAIAPKGVALAAELADGWFPAFYYPEGAADAWGASLATGLVSRDPSLGALDVIVGMPLYVGDDVEHALAAHRHHLALYIGGMGAKGANFYNDLATLYGFGDVAAEVQDRYLAGDKLGAAALVPDELLHGTALIGSESHVASRLEALTAAGVTTLLASPVGATPVERLASVEAARALIPGHKGLSSPAASPSR